MKFNLPRQIVCQEIRGIISREMRKQKMTIPCASRERLKEIAKISKAIEQWSLPKYLVCRKLPYDLGQGIFLRPDAAPILKGQVIAPYAGEVSLVPQNRSDDAAYAFAPLSDIHLKKEEQDFLDEKNSYHPRRLYSLKLDALKKGNFTRFINHSEKPNIVARLLSIPSNPYFIAPASIEVVYIAKKVIRPGEQLLVCYEDGEKSYWGVFDIKPFPMTPQTFQLTSSLRIANMGVE
ncbi:MAG: SET domain-containing protein [Simkania sp.]|nr:SET domain-containing protein [Simkania sp.]